MVEAQGLSALQRKDLGAGGKLKGAEVGERIPPAKSWCGSPWFMVGVPQRAALGVWFVTLGSLVVFLTPQRNTADRQTNMDRPVKSSSRMLECEELVTNLGICTVWSIWKFQRCSPFHSMGGDVNTLVY